jgi:uncharacterized protein YifE (UPF0438 family)
MKDAQASFLSLLDPETEQPTEANIENETEELESIEADAEEAQLVLADDDADVDDELIEDLEDDIEIPQEDLTFTVKINGEEIEVPVDELRKGYSRQADYTLKTQQLAEQRREAAQQLAAVNAEREQYANVLAGLQEQLHNSTAEPDWNALREADPNAYAVEWAAHQQRSQQQNAITEEQNRLRQIHHYQMQENAAAQLSDEQSKLMTAIPEWGDAEVARTEKLALIDYGKSIGFSEEELGNVTDHRSVLALRNAMRFSSLESKAKNVKPVNGKPTLKPGSSKTVPRKRTSLQRAQTRLQKTGTAAAAADVFAQMLDRE